MMTVGAGAMVGLWLALFLATAEPGGPEFVFTLSRPLNERDGETVVARLPRWRETYRFAAFGAMVAPPSAGADPAQQVALLDRLAEVAAPQPVLAVTPPVGVVGWEASNNPGYLPFGGRPLPVATPRDSWWSLLLSTRAPTVVLVLEGLRRDPTAAELGDYLDAVTTVVRRAERRFELWLPADWLAGDGAPALAALTAARLERIDRVALLDTWPAAQRIFGGPPEEGKETPEQAAERPWQALRKLIETAIRRFAVERLAVDLPDRPDGPAADAGSARRYLGEVATAGLPAVVLRGRPDTLQSAVWQAVFAAATRPE